MRVAQALLLARLLLEQVVFARAVNWMLVVLAGSADLNGVCKSGRHLYRWC